MADAFSKRFNGLEKKKHKRNSFFRWKSLNCKVEIAARESEMAMVNDEKWYIYITL